MSAPSPQPSAQTAQREFVTFGPVQLNVVDRDRSVAWWRDLIGLQLISERDGPAELGIEGTPLVVLRATATSPVRRGCIGLYHLAIYPPNEPELARVLARLQQSGHSFGTTDHAVAKSLYVNDPDGIGLEIAIETPERVKLVRWPETETEPVIIAADGRRRGGVEPLDVDQLLAALPDGDLTRPLPPGTKVGHVNLHVPDLKAAYSFYRDRLGFLQSNYAPLAGFGDLGAGIPLTHRIAVNTWQGIGAPPRPKGMAGMDHFTLRFDSLERLREVLTRLEGVEQLREDYVTWDRPGEVLRRADGVERRGRNDVVRDPAGNRIVLTAA